MGDQDSTKSEETNYLIGNNTACASSAVASHANTPQTPGMNRAEATPPMPGRRAKIVGGNSCGTSQRQDWPASSRRIGDSNLRARPRTT